MTNLKNELENQLKKEGLKESTIYGYMVSLNKLEEAGIDKINNETADKIIKFINDMNNKNTKKNYYKPVLKYTKTRNPELYEKFYEDFKKIANSLQKDNKNNKYSKKEINNKVEWEDIRKLGLRKMKTLDDKIFYQFIVKENLFLRLAIFNIKLKDYDEDKDNYIKDGYLFMNDYKNKNSLGKQRFKLKKTTMRLINKVDDDLLLDIGIDKNTKTNFYKRFFKRHLGKEINNNLLRKIYVNHHDFNKISQNQMEKKARKMLNTPAVWGEFYKKIN